MNKEIKDRWIADLRSGQYKQSHGLLRTTTSDGESRFCCLGVLYQQAVDAGITDWGAADDAYLSPAVCNWAGLDSTNPEVSHEGRPWRLAGLNDTGTPFTQIADLIEEQL